jgi:hypothetical protein
MFTPLTFGIALLVAIIIPRIVGGLPVEMLLFTALAVASVYTGFTSVWAGIVIATAPLIVSGMGMLYFYWIGQRALAGKMGQEQQWIAELVDANDEKFMESMEALERMEVREAIVIADSKEELRQTIITRAQESE